MKYLAINPDQIECLQCSSRFQADAQFCGFCGSPAVRKTIALNAVFKSDEKRATPLELEAISGEPKTPFLANDFDDFDDLDEFEKPQSKVLAMGVIATSIIAVGAMGFVLFLQANKAEPTAVSKAPIIKEKAVEVPVVVKAPKEHIKFQMATKKNVRELRAKDLLISISQAKDSRYKTIDKRAKSVLIRLNHAMEKVQKGDCGDICFAAVKNGKHSEVRFINEDGVPFRVMDVTKRDARKEKTSAHIKANLIVDQLNALVDVKTQPLATNYKM